MNEQADLKVIDPNGALQLPLAYDLGKVLHSLHGGYNIFTDAEFKIVSLNSKVFHLHYEFTEPRNELLRYLNLAITETWGRGMLEGSYLSELFHFSCLIPHHLRIKEEALALYLRAVELAEVYT